MVLLRVLRYTIICSHITTYDSPFHIFYTSLVNQYIVSHVHTHIDSLASLAWKILYSFSADSCSISDIATALRTTDIKSPSFSSRLAVNSITLLETKCPPRTFKLCLKNFVSLQERPSTPSSSLMCVLHKPLNLGP